MRTAVVARFNEVEAGLRTVQDPRRLAAYDGIRATLAWSLGLAGEVPTVEMIELQLLQVTSELIGRSGAHDKRAMAYGRRWALAWLMGWQQLDLARPFD